MGHQPALFAALPHRMRGRMLENCVWSLLLIYFQINTMSNHITVNGDGAESRASIGRDSSAEGGPAVGEMVGPGLPERQRATVAPGPCFWGGG